MALREIKPEKQVVELARADEWVTRPLYTALLARADGSEFTATKFFSKAHERALIVADACSESSEREFYARIASAARRASQGNPLSLELRE